MTAGTFTSFASFAILASGWLLVGQQVVLYAKGKLAVRLIDRAFVAHRDDGLAHTPWSWADFHPLARLDVERLNVHRAVLSNAAGSTLAFGMGLVDGTALPGSAGNTVLAGHRDSWAAFLEDLRLDDVVRLTTRTGVLEYRVEALTVVRSDEIEVLEPSAGGEQLTLVTCYPFEGVLRSQWRYIVRCTRNGDRHQNGEKGTFSKTEKRGQLPSL